MSWHLTRRKDNPNWEQTSHTHAIRRSTWQVLERRAREKSIVKMLLYVLGQVKVRSCLWKSGKSNPTSIPCESQLEKWKEETAVSGEQNGKGGSVLVVEAAKSKEEVTVADTAMPVDG